MDIETTKQELIFLLLQTKKESVLTKLMRVFEQEKGDWWNEISSEERDEINLGIKQADNGEFIENNVVMNLFNKFH